MAKEKFQDAFLTRDGETRAYVHLNSLKTLWFNTGTLCNLECENCYIESSPQNDRLVYITTSEVKTYLDEVEREGLPTEEVAFTGGEPFMNKDIIDILTLCLERGFNVLVLTNAMKPMQHKRADLSELNARYGDKLTIRVSVDHFIPQNHEEERGENTWTPMLGGLKWLSDKNFRLSVAGRLLWEESEAVLRAGFKELFAREQVRLDAEDASQLILFPEMDETTEVPEITTACWGALNISPDDMMCASSRMVVKRKGDASPKVLSCTLLAYDKQFEMGSTLKEASGTVQLNHPHCAKFCVLGGASCSG